MRSNNIRISEMKADVEANATGWSYFFRQYGLPRERAMYTCILHGIMPAFLVHGYKVKRRKAA